MKKSYITLIVSLLFSFFTKAQIQTPALSTAASLHQTVGFTDIDINYSRPSVKERIIFDEDGLLALGEFWRLGANSATKFTFSDTVMIAGQSLEKGSYTMLVKPTLKHWEFFIYPYESTDWNEYVLQTPLIIFKRDVNKTTDLQESFEISIQDIGFETAQLEFAWEHTRVEVPLTFSVTKPVMAAIESTMAGPSLNDFYQAALFMHENQIDLPKALSYIQNVTATDKALFFVVYREALILEDLKRTVEALASAKRSLKLSQEANNRDFVRLNEQLMERLK